MTRYVPAAILCIALGAESSLAQAPPKIDPLAAQRAARIFGSSRVIVSAIDAGSLPGVTLAVRLAGGIVRRPLPIIDAFLADVPNVVLLVLANNPLIAHITLDRVVSGSMERTGPTIGATAVRQELGYDGTGVGVAVIDSGVAAWHDDLSGGGSAQRVDRFVDFVDGRQAPYDDYGHGTHVAGIIAGNGFDSNGARAGVAPNARVIALKVLDRDGRGRISDVIAALDYVVANTAALNIRVVNLSVATGVYESYLFDPLTVAAHYGGLIDGYVMDDADSQMAAMLDLPVETTRILMQNLDDREALAHAVLDFADRIAVRATKWMTGGHS